MSAFRVFSRRATLIRLLSVIAIWAVTRGLTFAQVQDFGFDSGGLFGDPAAAAEISISASLEPVDSTTTRLNVTATLPDGYYIYSMDPSFGAATQVQLMLPAGLEWDGQWTADHAPKVVQDEVLGQTLEKFFGAVTWTATLRGSAPGAAVTGRLTGQYCGSGENGIPGECRQIDGHEFTVTLPGDAPAAADSVTVPSAVQLTPSIGRGRAAKHGLITFDIALTPEVPAAGHEVTLTVKATLKDGWHLYAMDHDPEMSGTPTEIVLTRTDGLEPIGESFEASGEPEIKIAGEYTQRIHHGEITWSRRFTATGSPVVVDGTITYLLCEESACLTTTSADFSVGLPGAAELPTPGRADLPAAQSPAGPRSSESVVTRRPAAEQGLLGFLLGAFGAGFIALLTPCVFPMVPVTVAFFLKQEEKKAGSSLRLAITYCLSIIGAFTVLGLLTAIAFGATALNEAANNRWLNLVFAALFFVFGLILLGAINVQVPSWLLNWSAKREASGGYVGVVFMALTFTLISFTCTFAFVGTVLVLATQGTYLRPVLGMLAFSAAFASPFLVLALFPSMLKRLPKSGGWMDDAKVTMGLIELALVLKFLSVADIGFSPTGTPRYLPYNAFLIGWIVLAAMIALYLLWRTVRATGRVTPGIRVGRFLSAAAFAAFGVLLTLGMAGKLSAFNPLWKQVAAFAPPATDLRVTADRGVVATHHDVEYSLEFDKAVAKSRQEGRLLFVDITGQNCVNCRLMERTVLASVDVIAELKQMECVQLYTDVVPGFIDMNARTKIRDRNIQLQVDLAGDVTLPTYLILSPDGSQVLGSYMNLDTSGGRVFLSFLAKSRERWEALRKNEVARTNARAAGNDAAM
jgi:thiol:disulfide interchange protein DsbD